MCVSPLAPPSMKPFRVSRRMARSYPQWKTYRSLQTGHDSGSGLHIQKQLILNWTWAKFRRTFCSLTSAMTIRGTRSMQHRASWSTWAKLRCGSLTIQSRLPDSHSSTSGLYIVSFGLESAWNKCPSVLSYWLGARRLTRLSSQPLPLRSELVWEVVVGFEKAIWSALKYCLPDITVHGCSFFWAQALYQKFKAIGLQQVYLNQFIVRAYIRQLMALPNLPADLIEPVIWDLKEHCPTITHQLAKLLKYIEKWVTSTSRPPPGIMDDIQEIGLDH